YVIRHLAGYEKPRVSGAFLWKHPGHASRACCRLACSRAGNRAKVRGDRSLREEAMSKQTQSVAAAIDELKALLGERLSQSMAVREQHGRDESWHRPALPDAVAFARSTEEVSRILAICNRHRVPVIPF